MLQDFFLTAINHHKERTGISLRSLSSASGLSTAYVSKILHGESSPTLEAVEALAYTLDIHPAALVCQDITTMEQDVSKKVIQAAADALNLELTVRPKE